MSTEASTNRKQFINRTSVYGLELAVALVTMIISVSVLSFAAFSLFNYIAGTSDLSEGAGYFALWTAASAVVWVPVAIIFYLRSRAQMMAKPDLHDNVVQRTFITIYQVVMILTVISFAVATVYAALMALVKPDETMDILLGGAVPSAISALLFWLGHVAFFRRGLRRRNFTLLFAGISAALIFPVVTLSVMSLRSVASDRTVETDLINVRDAISQYAEKNRETPLSLTNVASLVDSKSEPRLDDYTYTRVDSTRYQLCANFVAEANSYGSTAEYSDTYTTYPDFTQHDKGENCFKIRTDYYSAYDDIYGGSSKAN